MEHGLRPNVFILQQGPQSRGVKEQNMAKSVTRRPLYVSSQSALGLIESSDKIAWLSEARYCYETRLRDLEHQFESKAAELLQEYLAITLQIHESPER
jgi:hypothetical protein